MEIVYSVDGLADYLRPGGARAGHHRSTSTASSRTRSRSTSTRSRDGTDVWIAGIMQHVEEAGIHSGDSACVLPPHTLGTEMLGADPRPDRGDRAGARGRRPAQRPVRDPRGHAVRDRGQPARVADGAVRVQGDRAAGGQARLPGAARRAPRRSRPAAGYRPTGTCASRRSCCRSTGSPARTRCSAPRCARPAR